MLPNPALSPNKGKLQVQFQARYAFWCFFCASTIEQSTTTPNFTQLQTTFSR